ncbi:MAG: DUF1700 domain-containing protein [Erysipelothrix sp.]|nr:DUF1700 domain-containing protein [Erysipelothrix sp.]
MTKEEYLKRLKEQLNYYQGDHSEIISNYETIIDELIDEGHTMQDVISKLGRPGILADEIAEEFDLVYTEKTIQKTSMPGWAKVILILMALIVVIPVILSMVMGLVGTLMSIIVGIIFFLFGRNFTGGSIWGNSMGSGYRILATGTSIMGIISAIIITYFIVYLATYIIRTIVNNIRNTKTGGTHNAK